MNKNQEKAYIEFEADAQQSPSTGNEACAISADGPASLPKPLPRR